MTLHKCFDAALPPAKAPPHCDSVLGYIGGPVATRVWTFEEWLRFRHLRQFPAWVVGYQGVMHGDPVVEARGAAAAAEALGWAPGRAIVADTETAIDRGWYAVWADEIERIHGYVAVDYGSLSYALANAARLLWAADWNHLAQLQPGQTIEADQYQNDVLVDGVPVDLSVMSDRFWHLGGEGPRTGWASGPLVLDLPGSPIVMPAGDGLIGAHNGP